MVLISFQDLYKIHIFPKFQRCGSKIEPATPIWSLNFKRAWQAQFLSHTHETVEKYVFYMELRMILLPFFKINGIDLEMILVPFFDIPNQKPVIWKRLNFLLYDRPPLVWFHQNYTKGGLSGSRKIGLFQITGFWLGISKNGTNIISRSI